MAAVQSWGPLANVTLSCCSRKTEGGGRLNGTDIAYVADLSTLIKASSSWEEVPGGTALTTPSYLLVPVHQHYLCATLLDLQPECGVGDT